MNRKFICILLVIFILGLVACGAPADSEKDSSIDSADGDTPAIITATSLVSIHEAEMLLGSGTTLSQDDKEVPPGTMQCVYESGDVMLVVGVTQDALISGLNLENGGAANMFKELIEFQKADAPQDMFEVSGFAGQAYIIDLAQIDHWSLHALQDGYLVAVHAYGIHDKDETWALLEAAGKIALENLKQQL